MSRDLNDAKDVLVYASADSFALLQSYPRLLRMYGSHAEWRRTRQTFQHSEAEPFARFLRSRRQNRQFPYDSGELTSRHKGGIVCCRPPCAYRQEDDAVTLRSRYFLAAVAGLWMSLPSLGQEPARLQVDREQTLTTASPLSTNQRTAETIAEQLRLSGQMHQYRIDVTFVGGTADVSGSVADQSQREEALRIVQGVPGVERVFDHLALANESAITMVQATPLPTPTPIAPPHKAENGPENQIEPAPSGQLSSPSFYDVNKPPMPPYAWPTYAPFNNYSRVAYPEAYPYSAWPFIGPMYPFPKIPLGWRSVKLEWQDGHWWFSKIATKHDWWRVRYW